MQTIYLDISNKGVVPTVYAKQGDVGRKFEIVFTNSGLPYIPPNGSVFSVWYSGESGEGNYTDIGGHSAFSINSNKVTVEMISQMLFNDGSGILCLVLNESNGNQIGSWNIPYICEEVPGYGSEAANDYFTAFSQAVDNLPYPDASLSVPGKSADAGAVGTALEAKQNIATYHYDGAPVDKDVATWLDSILATMPGHSAVPVSGTFFTHSHVSYGILYKNNNDFASLYTTSYVDEEWRRWKTGGVWGESQLITRATKAEVDSLNTVFWATYDVTTAAEMAAAIQAGKLVMCKYENELYILTSYTVENYGVNGIFVNIDTNGQSTMALDFTLHYDSDLPNLWESTDLVIDFGRDYVIDQGTSGVWTYRKWASGIAECWSLGNIVDGTTIPVGNYSTTSIVLPFGFISTDQVYQISLNGVDSNTNLTVCVPWKAGETAIVRVINNGSSVANGVAFDLHITGSWK